jgi:hypothetical protein
MYQCFHVVGLGACSVNSICDSINENDTAIAVNNESSSSPPISTDTATDIVHVGKDLPVREDFCAHNATMTIAIGFQGVYVIPQRR